MSTKKQKERKQAKKTLTMLTIVEKLIEIFL
jgi:hypothetical protein